MQTLRTSLIALILFFSHTVFALQTQLITSIPSVSHSGDTSVFPNRIDYQNGHILVAYVTAPTTKVTFSLISYQTIIMLGTLQSDGNWKWEKKVIESNTIQDAYHAQASVAFDKEGHIHVAYNMHNMPWQYQRSTKPYDLSTLKFLGTPVSILEKFNNRYLNHTHFPDLGTSDIPYNQITYPRFFKDRHQNLYITYRFALKPKRAWEERAYSGGVAQYDTSTQSWHSIGGNIPLSLDDANFAANQPHSASPLVYDTQYIPYWLELAFDQNNTMHIVWNWRKSHAGEDTQDISYAYSLPPYTFFKNSQNAPYPLPINKVSSELITPPQKKYYSQKKMVIFQNAPLFVADPMEKGRELYYLDPNTHQWQKEPSPYGALELATDQQGRLLAFSSGIHVFRKDTPSSSWVKIGDIGNQNLCYAQVVSMDEPNTFLVYAKECGANDMDSIKLYKIKE